MIQAVKGRGYIVCALAAASALASSASRAAVVTLDFEGLKSQEGVLSYYDGGLGSQGSGPGPADGVTFSSNALVSVDADAGGGGNFGGEPSPNNVLFFLTGPAATLNNAAGFDTGFSFYYSAVIDPGFVNVYDGLNATGNLLASLNLPLTPYNGAPDPTGVYSPFVPIGVQFAGIAKSVDFGGTINRIGFDNITFGTDVPTPGIPEPSSLSLLGVGLIPLLRLRRR